MAAIHAVNGAQARPYGQDEWSRKLDSAKRDKTGVSDDAAANRNAMAAANRISAMK